MFVQALLVLLVATQVDSTCKCKPITIREAMCSSDTVIMASALTKEVADKFGETVEASQAVFRKYRMRVHTIYKEGAIRLSTNDSRYLDMLTPFDPYYCGVILDLNEEYHLSGAVAWTNGPLVMSSCNLVHRVPFNTVPAEEFHASNDLLTGQTKPLCEEFCVVFEEGVLHKC